MAVIPLNVPDAALPRVIDALCWEGGYDTLELPEGEAPPPRAQFAKSRVVRFVRETVRNHEANVAQEAARAKAVAKADAEVVIT